MSTLTDQNMYAIYAAGMAQALGLPPNAPNLILTGNSIPTSLATSSIALTPTPSTGQALAQIYQLGNTEALPQGIYDPSANSFFNNYATYIDNLIPQGAQTAPTPTQQAQINLIKAQLPTAHTTFNTDQASALAAYQSTNTMFPGQYSSFQSYLNQTSWGATLNTDSDNLDGLNSQLSSLYSTIYGQDYVAILANKTMVDNVRKWMIGTSISSPAVMSIASATVPLIVPAYIPSNLQTFSTWVDQTIGQHGNTGQSPITISFTSSSAEYDFSQSAYFSQTNFRNWFWSGSTTTSSSQVNINTSAQAFSLEMGFDALTQVTIQPGLWYDSSLMYAFPNTAGLIIPTSLIVGMYPTITLTMDQASYAQAKAAYSSSSGFGVGGFWCSAGTQSQSSGSAVTATWNASSNSVVMKSQSTTPVIVGMLVTKPG